MRVPKSAFLSVAPPTPNGNLHLGHLSGPYIASDIYRRYLALRGVPVVLVSGSDDNQSYVPAKGLKMGITPEEVAARFGDSVFSTLQKAGVLCDFFLRPLRTPEYVAFVQEFFRKLVDSGHLQEKEVDGFYCDHCRRHLFEAYLGGNCPHCNAETNAQSCEDCGFYNDGIDLTKPECNQCLKIPSLKRIRKFYFAVETQREPLAKYLSEAAMPVTLRVFNEKLLSKPLPEVSASFISHWGIPVPLPGYEGQVIYEWLEMAAGYLFMARKLENKIGGHAFLGKNDVEITQFYGFDNSFFYTAFIPALLLAFDPTTRLPRAFPSNQYLQLEGSKFSTSSGHAIWGDEFLEALSSDIVRFCLMHERPEREHRNFTIASCRDLVQSELVEHWETWLNSLCEHAKSYLPVPAEPSFSESIRLLKEEIEKHYSSTHFSMNQVTRALCRLVRLAEKQNSVANEWMAAKALAVFASPVLPNFSLALWRALGLESEMSWEDAITVPSGKMKAPLVWNEFSRALAALKKFEEDYRAKRP